MASSRVRDGRTHANRIRELKRRAEEINGGPVTSWTSKAMAPDLQEEFWRALARMRVFLGSTDHLNDRELDALLWSEVLPEDVPMLSADAGSTWYVDLVSTGSEENTHLLVKHYADEAWRRQWIGEFPDYVVRARGSAIRP